MARTIVGTVVSDKGNKTIVINVTQRKTHPLYKKQYTVNTKFMAHDEKNEAQVGDRVSVSECRPMSARKRFSLQKVLERGGVRFEEEIATADIPQDEPKEEAQKSEPRTSAKKAEGSAK